ncbi:right-handed parallel beta-helix repeat-containing protein [Amycolatopsis sp. FDAARGOS 1241]|uniref:right-handed parallel beta-helix repeat-containing protein n=1 Tax=Amycolatopsis sp. FDAARGOS 1241 TaxID=2778070 RepID=UPI001950BC09|nr:right-handed parallel beta-helix repeat-containing protein [Amycolatopsis sp. FDAARGOS 1241]QRP49767.1 right-handed parallel beta-helix repeat-containing protein [Amycolatopsis sp. FDAARGOS 1241]
MAGKVRVSPGRRGAHQTIASALGAVSGRRDARVEIDPGRYPENLFVSGEVHVFASRPGTVEICPPTGTAVETSGVVRLEGLIVSGRDNDVVRCAAGSLTITGCTVTAQDGSPALHAPPGTAVAASDSEFRYGRAVFTGSRGTVKRCVFTDSSNNGLAATGGADVAVLLSRFDRCRIHGVLVRGGRVAATECGFAGTGNSALAADQHGHLDVTDCRIDSARTTAISYGEQSRGTITGTTVEDADTGLLVTGGSDPLVRRCAFTGCRVAGIEVNTQGLGRFEEISVLRTQKFGLFVDTQGSPAVHRCRFAEGNLGIVVQNAHSRVTDTVLEDLKNAAVRLLGQAQAELTGLHVTRCPTAVETNGTAYAELAGARLQEIGLVGVVAQDSSRVRATDCGGSGGHVAFSALGKAHLVLHDCRAAGVTLGGAGVLSEATVTARRFTVTGPVNFGVYAAEKSTVDVADSSFAGTTVAGIGLIGSATALVRDCEVPGPDGLAVHHQGRAVLERLRSPLRVVEVEPDPEPPRIINNYTGPVIHGDVIQSVLTWGNTVVHQTRD